MALDGILARKRVDVAARKQDQPLAGFRDALRPSDRSFLAALRRPHTGFILECKKASPSKGVIRADFDVAAIAHSYAPFADAISVLTDEPYFQGQLAYLSAVREIASCPVLCKDFIVDAYQIYEARHFGADAVLLMCSVLDQSELNRCLDTCRELAMHALVEVHDAAELERALDTDAAIIGINNRNLKTLQTDLATSEELCPQVPRDRVCVCESGIGARGDIHRLRDICDAFLIGGHLMASTDLDRAIREVVFGRTKICGLTATSDARAAHAAGAILGGVVLWPGSKRAMTVAAAEQMCREVPLSWVGVFVNERPENIAEAVRRLDLSIVQLHGDEDREHVAAVRTAIPPTCTVWKAQRVSVERPIDSAASLGADRVLVDRFVAGEPGGTGKRFDWTMFGEHPERHEMVLSGGIAVHSAAEAESLAGFAIDLSSGVESAPGQKDARMLAALFAALRGRGRLRGDASPRGRL